MQIFASMPSCGAPNTSGSFKKYRAMPARRRLISRLTGLRTVLDRVYRVRKRADVQQRITEIQREREPINAAATGLALNALRSRRRA